MQKQIYFHIDRVEQKPDGIYISGWAFSRRGEVEIHAAGNLPCELQRVKRPDVIDTYKADEELQLPGKPGFICRVAHAGQREVKLIISDGTDEETAVCSLQPGTVTRLRALRRAAGKLLGSLSRERVGKFRGISRQYGLKYAVKHTLVALGLREQAGYQEKYLLQRPSAKLLARQRRTHFPYEPLISLIVPVYNPPVKFLREMIESVQAQSYSKWELCLADGSTEEAPWRLLSELAARDSRLKIKRLAENLGISGNSNAALELATGDYIALFDHDDILPVEALFELVRALNPEQGKRPDFIYTDEDKINESCTRYFDPHFKPDFSPDFLNSNNYICHLTAMSAQLLAAAGGSFRSEYDGAQDYDLVLRATEKAESIVHIPKVLYHWRTHPGSTAGDSGHKGYTHEAGRRALAEHLRRLDRPAQVRDGARGRIQNVYKVDYEVKEKKLVSIIIPNCNHKADLEKCLQSIWDKTTYPAYELLVAENNSTEADIFAYYEELETSGRARILRWGGPFNYAAINNWAARQAKGEYLLFLNNDIEIITPGWIEELVMYAQHRETGAVGAKLYYPDGTVQHAGVILGLGGVANHSHLGAPHDDLGYFARLALVQNVSAVTGALLLMRRKVFEEVEGFDEEFIVAFNDVDLCLRVHRAGYLNIFNPEAEAWHSESKSRGSDADDAAKQERFQRECEHFYRRWGQFPVDPYYNVNLTLGKEDFSLR